MRRIVTGGQTGADRAALDFAVRHGVPYGGWCPRGGWAEDRPRPPGLLADYPALRETATADPAERTALNVRDGDATLVVVDARVGGPSPGTSATLASARELGRPWRVIDVSDGRAPAQLRAFLDDLADDATLNVAGARESESPGLYARTGALLEACRDCFPT